MLNKFWEALSKPIIPPKKAQEMQAKTDSVAGQIKQAIADTTREVVTKAKAVRSQTETLVQQQITGQNGVNIQVGGDLYTDVPVLGNGSFTFRCRGYLCRSEIRNVTAGYILRLMASNPDQIQADDLLYYMPVGGRMNTDAVCYRRTDLIDLQHLPEFEDPRYGFGIYRRINGEYIDL